MQQFDKIQLIEGQEPSSSIPQQNHHHGRAWRMVLLGFILAVLVVVVTVPSVLLSERNNTPSNDDDQLSFDMWCLGRCSSDIFTISQPGVVMMGGGIYTDEAFEWQITNANGGDFVVLVIQGYNDYNDYLYNLSLAIGRPLNSATTISFNDPSASYDEIILTKLRNAEAIFFAGGDQTQELQFWNNTPIQSIIQNRSTTVTVGGTSAGCMILGRWIYAETNGSVTLSSSQAMSDPYDPVIAIVHGWLKLPFLETVLLDTHFVVRNRMGRTLTFEARVLQDSTPPPLYRGIGVDEQTAFILNVTTGIATAVGVGTVYVCNSTQRASTCSPETPLTFTNVTCIRFSGPNKDYLDFNTFQSPVGVKYFNSIINAKFVTSPYGPNFTTPVPSDGQSVMLSVSSL